MNNGCILALGFFDGVHLGHGGLLDRTCALGREAGLPACALTFDIHPSALLQGSSVPLLSTVEDRQLLMARYYGIDRLYPLHFDRQTMEQPWEDFVRTTVAQTYGARHVVCGHDFHFGARGEGNPRRLKELCAALGLGCDVIPEVRMDGGTISSTRIRSLILKGDMTEAVRLLGHGHLIRGTVVQGRHLGRTIGIPTANILPAPGLLVPCHGVYAARAFFREETRLAVVNVGSRPTVEGHRITVEPWILDFQGDLYGEPLALELFRFLRPERKFPSLEALQAEIFRNAEETRQFFLDNPV